MGKEQLFNRFMEVKSDIQMLSSIVQNEGIEVSQEELDEWSRSMSGFIEKVDDLRDDVLNHYDK